MTRPRIFLSYSRRYVDWVRVLHANLEHKDCLGPDSVFLDEKDIGPGRSWREAIQDVITRSATFVFVATPESLASAVVEREWNAFANDHAAFLGEQRFQMLRLVDSPLPPFLKDAHWLDFTDPSQYRESLSRLVSVLSGDRDPRARHALPRTVRDAPALPATLDSALRRRIVSTLAPLLSTDATRRHLAAELTDEKNPRLLFSHASDELRASAALVEASKDATPEEGALQLIDVVERAFPDQVEIVKSLTDLRPTLRKPARTPAASAVDPLTRYFDYLKTAHSRLVPLFKDAATKTLDLVHVEIDIDAFGRGDVELRQRTRSGTLRELLHRPVDTTEGAGNTGRWILYGHAGAGKTTIARYLTWKLASEGDGPIPIYVPLASLAENKLSPLRLVAEELEAVDAAEGVVEAIEAAAGAGRPIWFLLDGFDEVAPEKLRLLPARVGSVGQGLPNVRVAVFSRPLSELQPFPQFQCARLHGLSGEKQLTLAEQWLPKERAAELMHVLRGRPALALLACNPLLLTLMISLARSDDTRAAPERSLPSSRIELYRQSIQHLLEERYRGDEARARTIDIELLVRGLQELALALQETESALWTRDELEKLVRANWKRDNALNPGARWASPRAFLDEVDAVLGPHDGPNARYSFLHRQFREYLAACALAERGPADYLKRASALSKAALPRWSEVFGLLCGLVEDPRKLIEELRTASTGLVARALPHVEGVPLRELLGLLDLTEWDVDLLCALVLQHPAEEARDELWELVSDERATEQLAFLHFALARIGPTPDPVRFFRQCKRPLGGGPEIDFVRISAGQFTMGSAKDDLIAHNAERPSHPVRVKSFDLARTPITREQFLRFEPKHEFTEFAVDSPEELDQLPATDVSWWQAYIFCAWIGARLPNEAEWEYACRAGTLTKYSFGDDASRLQDFGWYFVNSGKALLPIDSKWEYDKVRGEWECRARPVGSKPENAFGLRDMHGNVWEWCADHWHASYRGAPDDGSAWTDETAGDRVIRGGSFGTDAECARSAFRLRNHRSFRWYLLGFRPARSVTTD